jgi:glutathione S-transferase
MLTVHHLGISQSERIVWLCEELELPYRLLRYERDAVTRLAPAEYKALHPGGTFTAADIIMLFPLTTKRAFAPRDLSRYSNIRAYLQRIGARPAYQRAMKKADPQLKPLLS